MFTVVVNLRHPVVKMTERTELIVAGQGQFLLYFLLDRTHDEAAAQWNFYTLKLNKNQE